MAKKPGKSAAFARWGRRSARSARSVPMMLQATRQPEFERLPMAAVVAAVTASKGRDSEAPERALLALEREVGFRSHIFAWSQSFVKAKSRRDLSAWLAERGHRWDDWGEFACRQGADALTRHLLSVIVGTRRLAT